MIKNLICIAIGVLMTGSIWAQNYFARNYHYINDSVPNVAFSDVLMHPNGFLYIKAHYLKHNFEAPHQIIKMDTLGNVHWVKQLNINTGQRVRLVLDYDSNMVFAIGTGIGPLITAILKIDTAGSIIKQKFIGNKINMFYGDKIQSLSNEKYLLMGTHGISSFDLYPSGFLSLLDSNFNPLWQKTYSTNPNLSFYILESSDFLSDKSIICTGRIKIGNNDFHKVIMRIDSLGNIITSKVMTIQGNSTHLIEATDSLIHIAVNGEISLFPNPSDYFISFVTLDYSLNVISEKSYRNFTDAYSFGQNIYESKKLPDNKYILLQETSYMFLDSSLSLISKINSFGNPWFPYYFTWGLEYIEPSNSFVIVGTQNLKYGAFIKTDGNGAFGCEYADTSVYPVQMGLYTLPLALTDSSMMLAFDSSLTVSSRTTSYISNCNLLSVEENIPQQGSINVFPNPFLHYFEIDADVAIQTMEVFAMDGKILLSESAADLRNKRFSILDFPAGLYFVRCSTSNRVYTKKLIKL